MRSIITTRKVSGLGLIRACISGNWNRLPADDPPENKQDRFAVPVRITVPVHGGELLIRAGLMLHETLVIVITDARSVVVSRQLIRAGSGVHISGLKKEVYTFRIYNGSREICAGRMCVT